MRVFPSQVIRTQNGWRYGFAALCWAPLLIFNVLQAFGYIDDFLMGTVKHLKTAFSLMAYFNR